MNVTPRPTPLRDVAVTWSKLMGIGGGFVTTLLTAGVLSVDQAGALGAGLTTLDVLCSAVLGVVAGGSAIVAAFRTARTGEQLVTPLVDPMNEAGQRLVPEVPPVR